MTIEQRLHELEARLQKANDVADISNLMTRYSNAADRGWNRYMYDGEEVASFFTTDAVWDGGSFGSDQAYPNGLGGSSADVDAAGRTQFAMRVTSNLTIPAGQYTISVSSDDGFRLKIPGVTFTKAPSDGPFSKFRIDINNR